MSFSQHTSEFDRLQTNFNNFQEDSEDDEESPPSYQQGKESWHKKIDPIGILGEIAHYVIVCFCYPSIYKMQIIIKLIIM